MLGTPFVPAFMPEVPEASSGRRVVEPDVDALDQEPGDADVVVLEDEHATPQLVAARAGEDVLDDALPRAVRGMGLAGEDDLDGPLFVAHETGQAVDVREDSSARLYVAKRRAKPIVRTLGSKTVSSSSRVIGASPWRANWLRSRPRAKTASSSFWRWWASHSSRAGMREIRSQKRRADVASSSASRSASR